MPPWLPELLRPVRDLIDAGGPVVTLILGVTFLMWVLILERIWYFARRHPREAEQVRRQWEARTDRTSWRARQIRRLLLCEVRLRLEHSLFLIRTLVALCPLLGLLGTVTGMIEVFEVMAVAGSGNARAMASGVSRATIPTMAGMVAAISGLLVSMQLERFARNEAERLADRLTHA